MSTMTFYVNNDTADSPLNTSGIDWTEVSIVNDKLIFSAGSTDVIDGGSIPTADELNQAGTVVSAVAEVEVDKCFLEDVSASILKEIHNWGSQNKRYVFAFDFDGATASEPVLEIWDDDGLDTTDNYSLGDGTPADSWWFGVTTTDALPGASWAGTALAGSGAGRFLYLNNGNGALVGADTLYCNLKIVIPVNPTQGNAESPVICCKFTSN